MRREYQIYLSFLALLAMALAAIASGRYGAGVSTDASLHLSTADNLLHGNGFFDYAGNPFLHWPPLYPILLAGFSWLSGLDVFIVGWALNIACLGAIVWLGGAWLWQVFEGHPLWAAAAALPLALSPSLLRLAANIGTDPLFIVLFLAFTLALERYLRRPTPGWLALAVGLAALACLQRVPGLAAAVGGALLVGLKLRREPRGALLHAGLFLALALLPIGAWVVLRNLRLYGTLMGARILEQTLPLENLRAALGQMSRWVIPASLEARISWVIWLVGMVLLGLLTGRRLARRLSQPALLAAWVPGLVYFLFVLFTVNTLDSNVYFYDRYEAPLLAVASGLLGAALQGLAESRSLPKTLTRIGLPVLFAAWMVYPGSASYQYVRLSWAQGETSYNLYNTRALQESGLVGELHNLQLSPQEALYSNYPAAAWFYTRHRVTPSPRVAITIELDIETALVQFAGWPNGQGGYLVWFLPNEYDHVLPPEVLERLAELEMVYAGKEGRLYRVGPSLSQ